MFSSVKLPKNLCEYRLFRGAADFGNLQQWDLYETGYSFITVVSVPKYISYIAKNGGARYVNQEIVCRLLNDFVYIVEHEFRGLTGLGGLTAETTTITDGISELQMINKVTEDTSVTVEMKFFEKSGRPLTKFQELVMRGIKDTRTQGKHYWGLIESGAMTPGFENEVFSFLYYITDNTYRNLETAVLLMCAQFTEVPLGDFYDSEKGQYSNPEVTLRFNCFPITNDDVNTEAARLLEFLLSDKAGKDKIIVDTQSAKDFYHIDGNTTVSQGIKQSYGLGIISQDATSYSNAANSNEYSNNYNTYKNIVDAKTNGTGQYKQVYASQSEYASNQQ